MALPYDTESWQDRARTEGLLKSNQPRLQEISKMASASKVGLKDWLQLRVLWKVEEDLPTHEDLFGASLDSSYTLASDLQKSSKEFLESLPWYGALHKNSSDPREWYGLAMWRESSLALVRRAQTLKDLDAKVTNLKEAPSGEDLFKLRIEPVRELRPRETRERVKPASHGSNEDENSDALSDEGSSRIRYGSSDGSQSESHGKVSSGWSYNSGTGHLIHQRPPGEEDVNYSFLALLGGLCIYDSKISSIVRWSARRQQFAVCKPEIDGKSTEVIAAATDGCLQYLLKNELDESCPSLAIVEVKARRRKGQSQQAIQIQEGAEMAAWVSSQPASGLLPARVGESGIYRRIILSQDFDDIYVTLATYDEQYVDFITGKRTFDYRERTPDSPTIGASKTPDLPLDAELEILPSGQGSPPSRSTWDGSIPMRTTHQRTAHDRSQKTPSPEQQGDSPPMAPSKQLQRQKEAQERRGQLGGMFLTMHQYGPFRISSNKEMKQFMVLLISIVRVLCREHNPLGSSQ